MIISLRKRALPGLALSLYSRRRPCVVVQLDPGGTYHTFILALCTLFSFATNHPTSATATASNRSCLEVAHRTQNYEENRLSKSEQPCADVI